MVRAARALAPRPPAARAHALDPVVAVLRGDHAAARHRGPHRTVHGGSARHHHRGGRCTHGRVACDQSRRSSRGRELDARDRPLRHRHATRVGHGRDSLARGRVLRALHRHGGRSAWTSRWTRDRRGVRSRRDCPHRWYGVRRVGAGNRRRLSARRICLRDARDRPRAHPAGIGDRGNTARKSRRRCRSHGRRRHAVADADRALEPRGAAAASHR